MIVHVVGALFGAIMLFMISEPSDFKNPELALFLAGAIGALLSGQIYLGVR
jgi:hypothetical protein